MGTPEVEPDPAPVPEPEVRPAIAPGPEPVARARPRGRRRRPVAAPPEGVPADEPIWDRRNKRYVLWHSKAGRWLTHGDHGWAPLGTAEPADAPPGD